MSIVYLVSQSTAASPAIYSLNNLIPQVNTLILNAISAQTNDSAESNSCINAVNYHFAVPGQQVRAKICLDACIKFGIIDDDMLILAAVTELLHNASLIHDDIQDNDDIRRNQPAVWKQFGVNIAICAGDLLLSTAYALLSNYSQPKLLPSLIATIHAQTRLAIEGQSKDITHKKNLNISIEQYLQIASRKSGALLSLPVELALVASKQNEYIDLSKTACMHFAIGYQMADDLDDIDKDTGSQNVHQSINITTVLSALGHNNPQALAADMCQEYLNKAIAYSQQLPNESGLFLSNLADTLKVRVTT